MRWPIVDAYLGTVEGADAGNVRLMQNLDAFFGGVGQGPFWSTTDRGIEAQVTIRGATAAAAAATVASIADMLVRAERGTGVYGSAPVVLSLQLVDTTWRYVDVTGGRIEYDRNTIGGKTIAANLLLLTRPYARGDRYTATLDPATTRTNGAATVLIEDIPGDVPALARVTVEDVSTNSQVINGLHLFSHSAYGLEAADWDPVIEFAAMGAASDQSDSTGLGSSVATGGSDTTWKSIAYSTRPTTDTTGLFDVRLRVRDAAGGPTMPSNVEANVAAGIFSTGVTLTTTTPVTGTSTTSTFSLNGGTTPVPVGSVLVFYISGHGSAGASISSITAVGGGTWTLATDGSDDARVVNGTNAQMNVYWLRTTTAITTTTAMTITWGATKPATVHISMTRVDGLVAAGNPVEQVSADNTGSSSPVTASSVTTTQAYQWATYAMSLFATSGLISGIGSASNSFSSSAVSSTTTPMLYGSKTLTSAGAVGTVTRAYTGTVAWGATLVTFKAASASAGSITTGSWDIRVASEGTSGQLSAATTAVSVIVESSTDTITVTWDAGGGNTTGYRVYRDRGSGWGYFTTTNTSYVFTTESGITSETPPDSGSGTVPSEVRLAFALSDGTLLHTTPATRAVLANADWEDLSFAAIPLPPIAALDGAGNDDWRLEVQIRNSESGIDFSVDCAWLAHRDDPAARTEYAALDLATKGDWVLETRRDGITTARLYQSGTTTALAQVTPPLGRVVLGPGSALLTVRMTVAGGLSDVVDAKADLAVEITPRYRLLAGT